MFKHLRNYFLTGILVLLPLAITIKLLFWGFEKTDAILGNFIYHYLNRYLGVDVRISGLGLIALLLAITLTGIFARNYLGKKLIETGERLLKRIPVFSSVYSLTKQFAESLTTTQANGKGAFRQVVLVEYPRQGIWSPGFLTGEAFEEANERLEGNFVSVFVPTVPNPTTGFLVLVPQDQVKIMDMSVEDGFKLIISAGVIAPAKKTN
ncbi:MAG TPA: DUF502 domain-containing protein [Bacillota bacterium]|nr:DUF502 domain-containing protein [Bacillota bacterium]